MCYNFHMLIVVVFLIIRAIGLKINVKLFILYFICGSTSFIIPFHMVCNISQFIWRQIIYK